MQLGPAGIVTGVVDLLEFDDAPHPLVTSVTTKPMLNRIAPGQRFEPANHAWSTPRRSMSWCSSHRTAALGESVAWDLRLSDAH
jgi:hypothetical protein